MLITLSRQICQVLSIYLYVRILLFMCPHTAVYVWSSRNTVCVSAVRLQHKICVPAYTHTLSPSLSLREFAVCVRLHVCVVRVQDMYSSKQEDARILHAA
jgi:hypothetical protein